MSYLNKEEMNDGNQKQTIEAGETARVVLTSYEPFTSKKGTKIPKHLGFDNDTGARYEFVGFVFHDAVKELNDSITPNVTVLEVQCLDNGTQYPDYALNLTSDKVNTEYASQTAKPVEGAPIDAPITEKDLPF